MKIYMIIFMKSTSDLKDLSAAFEYALNKEFMNKIILTH